MTSSTDTPSLFDSLTVDANAARARLEAADFLHRAALCDIRDRLESVNRSFQDPALIARFLSFWTDVLPPSTTLRSPDPTLKLSESAHDLVLHAMALHWSNDPLGQIIQCRRALKPDGLFMAVCFGGDTLRELRAVLAQAEAEITGGLAPRVAPMAELRDLGGLLSRAGLNLTVADRLVLPVSYPNMFALIRDLRAMGETNALAARHKLVPPRRLFMRAAEIYAATFPSHHDPARIKATFELIFLTGWSPHASQPKPLRPGSARLSLTEVLPGDNGSASSSALSSDPKT